MFLSLSKRWVRRCGVLSFFCLVTANRVVASEFVLPSGVQPTTIIDLLTDLHWQQTGAVVSPRCSDSVFVRRAYLDLVGRIPTPSEANQFLKSLDSSKRELLLESLCASNEFGRRMSELFDAVLMGRKGARKQKRRIEHGWHDYLADNFNRNRPWNEMVREILLARPNGEADRGAVWFLYERNNNYQDIAEAIAPGFFGMQIQCAQCHDHPLVDEIEQRHYWGLVAFFNRGENVDTPNGPRVGESAIGGFAKFTDLAGDASDALLTFLGKAHVVSESRPAEGKEEDSDDNYVVRDADGSELNPRVPKFSRREEFVQNFVADNRLIARAFVNRIWAMMLGRGIIHPVDEMDSMHDASHPQLLDWLAQDFEQSDYDVKRLIKSIGNSRVYQLDAKPLGDVSDESTFAWALQKPLAAESLYRSILVAVDGSMEAEKSETLNQFRDVFPDVFPAVSMSILKQSLFLTNSGVIHETIELDDDSQLSKRVDEGKKQTVVRTAFQTAFGRLPEDEEFIRSMAFLEAREGDLRDGARQLMWALVTSAEFRFNH